MTVLYTGAFRFPASDAAAARVLNNAKILRELDYDVVFISFGGKLREVDKHEDGNYYYQGFRYMITDDIDVKQSNVVKRIFRFIYSGRNALSIIKEMISSAEIIIAYQPPSYFTKQLIKLCKLNCKKFVTDLTEWYAPTEFPGGIFAPFAWVNEWNMRFVQKKVLNKIVISSYLNNYYVSSNNIILPPLIDKGEKKWKDHKEVLPPFNGIRFIYAGTPARKDLIKNILEAVLFCLKQKLNVQFIIVGVSKNDIAYYKNIQEIRSFPEHVIFCGRVLQTEVPAYYNASDFSIIIRESNRKNMAGFPTKLAETMMAGRPVILNYTSDISEYVRNGYNGFVIPGWSSNELKNVLVNAANLSREEIEVMKSNSLQCAIEKFNYSAYTDKIDQFIKRVR